MILDAKVRFQASPYKQTLFDLVATDMFQSASVSALVTMQQRLSSKDMGDAAANAFRLEGARMFLDIFMSLSDPEPDRKPNRSGQLNYQA